MRQRLHDKNDPVKHTAEHYSGINIGTINIIDGRQGRLEMICHTLKRYEIDIGVLTETKLNGFHTVSSYGYNIMASKGSNGHQGGVAIITRKSKYWHTEGFQSYGPNVVKCTIVHEHRRTTLIGVYIPPSDDKMQTIQHLDDALHNENIENTIIMGDFNAHLEDPKDPRQAEIVDALFTYELRNLAKQFKCKRNKPYNWTWRQHRDGQVIQAVCDYILSGKCLLWNNCKVVDLPFDTDHRMVKGKLVSQISYKYQSYLKKRQTPTVELFEPSRNEDDSSSSDQLLKYICDEVGRQKPMDEKDRSWISSDSFQLMKEKAQALRCNDSTEVDRLGRELRRSIRKDRRDRIWKISTFVEESLKDGDIIGAYGVLRHWYKKFTGKAITPSPIDLQKTRETFANLLTKDEEIPDSTPYDFPYQGPAVDDSIPQEDEIRSALFKMRSRKAPGLTQLSVDHLKQWYNEGHPQEGDGDEKALEIWDNVVTLVQRCIGEGDIPQAFFYGVLVIIPKDDAGGVRGIGLLEVIHKLVSQVINLRMATSIEFLEEVHGFRCGRGTYTAIGETKIRLQMAVNKSETTYQVYLDLKKAYDSINRPRVLHIMRKYGVGPNICRYVETVWNNQSFLLRQRGFYSEPFAVTRGCTQGDIDSPIIFNIIVDAVLRTWKNNTSSTNTRCCFYADDGLLENLNPEELQKDLDDIIKLFERVGLRANEKKTKFMIVRGANAPTALSTAAYNNIAARHNRRRPIDTNTYEQRRRQLQTCIICGKQLQATSLRRHTNRQHNNNTREYQCMEIGATGVYYLNDIRTKIFNHCPVPNCTGGGKDKSTFYRHFCLRHPNADIIVHSDGVLPKCQLCGMRCTNLQRHQGSATCKKAHQRRRHEKLQKEQARANDISFTVNGKQIDRVNEFRYLGIIFSDDDDDT